MQLLKKNIVFFKVNDNPVEYMLINTLNGIVEILTADEAKTVIAWANKGIDIEQQKKENTLFNTLLQHHFFVKDDTEEKILRDNIIKRCVDAHEKKQLKTNIAVFIPTYSCNFSCPYCFEDKVKDTAIMTQEMVDKVLLEQEDKLQIVGLFGGEPFLPETYDIIKYILGRVNNKRIFAVTNGFYLNRFIPILSKMQVDYIQVTLDGFKELHDKMRVLVNGGGTFDIIFNNITEALHAHIPIKIRMNITPHNMEQCLRLRAYLSEYYKDCAKLLTFELQPLFQIPKSKANALEQHLLYSEDCFCAQDAYAMNGIRKTLSPLIKLVSGMEKSLHPVVCGCGESCSMLFYDSYGDIYSCVRSVGKKNLSVGTFFPKNTKKDNSLFVRNINTIPACQNCALALLCGGGCGYAVSSTDGDVNNPNCSSIVNELNVIIPSIYSKAKHQKK